MPGTGCACSIAHVLPDDFAITLVSTFGSTPKPSAILNASLTATMATPAIRLLQSLATSPAPTGPTWMMLAPIAASAGRASSRSAASPPTMIASVAFSAPPTPPETGASMKRTPRSLRRAATRWDTAGSIVDMSTQSRPLATPSSTPPAPRYAASTWLDDGSMVTTRSDCLAASAAEPHAVAPSLTAASTAAGTMSYAITPKPLAMRFRTIGCPIVPVPTNPIFMKVSFLSTHPPRRRGGSASEASRGGVPAVRRARVYHHGQSEGRQAERSGSSDAEEGRHVAHRPHRSQGQRSRPGDQVLRGGLRISPGPHGLRARSRVAPHDRRHHRSRADGLRQRAGRGSAALRPGPLHPPLGHRSRRPRGRRREDPRPRRHDPLRARRRRPEVPRPRRHRRRDHRRRPVQENVRIGVAFALASANRYGHRAAESAVGDDGGV